MNMNNSNNSINSINSSNNKNNNKFDIANILDEKKMQKNQ